MTCIRDFLTDDHRRCDDVFAMSSRPSLTATGLCRRYLRPLQRRRAAAFCGRGIAALPGFRAETGMTMGPTQVMRSEHVQMRELIAAAGGGTGGRMPTNTPAMLKPC